MNSNGGGEFLTTLLLLVAAAFAVYVLAIIGIYALIILSIFAAFVSFAWTFVCLVAWRQPFQLGKIYLHSEAARAFVWRGVYGALAVPSFLGMLQLFFHARINWGFTPYYLLAGYTLLSVGVEYLFAKRKNVPYVYHDLPPQRTQIPAPKSFELIPPPSRKPRYASWNDEEEFK